MTCTRTVLPVGIMSIVALPSGSVLTSRLPWSLPSIVASKMTAALLMGLPCNFFRTVTSMWEVAGGALYFRPCFSGASCAMAGRQENRAMQKRRARWDQSVRRNGMGAFYDFLKGACGVGAGTLGRTGLRDFHSDFTLGI